MTRHTAFFGYGSLVNRATHDFDRTCVATLTGWRRVWRHNPARVAAYLSVEPDPEGQIDGLVADVDPHQWDDLDYRERTYGRHDVSHQTDHALGAEERVALYQVQDLPEAGHPDDHPVLLSYLDVVVQGYLLSFGQDGAARFFETTAGWDTPVLDDRAAPIYSRAQTLTADQTTFVDDMLSTLSAVVKKG